MSMNQVASDLYKALTESDERKPKSGDIKATVVREEGNIVFVKFPGGEDETPVLKTNNANVGDDVTVRLDGGRAWLVGNETNPATDNAVANAAGQLAEGAHDLAKLASSSAQEAQRSATIATAYANVAKDQAEEAIDQAGIATGAANTALLGLSQVEEVVEVLDWIALHGEYVPNTDLEPQEDTRYYVVAATVVSNPVDDYILGYYEYDGEIYYKTSDPTVYRYYKSSDIDIDPEKIYYISEEVLEPSDQYLSTYYELSNNVLTKTDDYIVDSGTTYYTVSVVEEPSESDLDLYYEKKVFYTLEGTPVLKPNPELMSTYYKLNISDALSTYVASHLSLTNKGLYLMTDGSPYKILITSSGVQIIGNNGIVAEYGPRTIIGNALQYHIEITPSHASDGRPRLSFMNNQTEIAYLSNNELYIPRAVVVESMQVGYWRWIEQTGTENLNLFWVGGGS